MLHRIIKDSISSAWQKYITFATYVVGISGGVRIYQLERYLEIPTEGALTLELTTERWTVEVFRTIIETLQSIAWMYLVIFIVALIADRKSTRLNSSHVRISYAVFCLKKKKKKTKKNSKQTTKK